ncbi:MAG: fumarylacetoacetate hydrolase family protein [Melioribacteraceae bacterium]
MKSISINNRIEKIQVGKIVCVGRNYVAHAKEMGNEVPKFPIIFLKTASNLVFNGDDIVHPTYSNDMHHEVELVLLIGETIKNANDDEAKNAIYGYAVGLDMTLRDIQLELRAKGQPWTLAKCFDTSAVVSDFILTSDYKFKGNEKIELYVNDELRQNSSLDKMIFSPIEIIKFISSKMTLEKGDLIYTGTPAGVGKVVKGDRITCQISEIGSLSNKVI